jgi:hypothetical protein
VKHAARSDNETIVVDMAVLLPPCFGQNQELLEVTAQDREIRKFTLNPELQPVQLFLADASSAGCQRNRGLAQVQGDEKKKVW